MNTIKIKALYTYTSERRFVWFLCLVFLGFVTGYILLVGATAYTVSAHGVIQYEKQQILSRVGDSESEYRRLSSNITALNAARLGFSEPAKEIFAFRKRLVHNDTNF